VSGHPTDIQQPDDVLGISPGTCSIIETSIVFAFSDRIGDYPQSTCEIIAQELAHSIGLDHEYLCEDVMTYLRQFACGPRSFQDSDVPCGEYEARPCWCGNGPTQNSFRMLLERLGAYDDVSPEVVVLTPADGDVVPSGFEVTVYATDDAEVQHTELLVDGTLATTSSLPPFTLYPPADIPPGPHTLEVRAYDTSLNSSATATLSVTVVPACEIDAGCPAGNVCIDMVCYGALGTPCDVASDCATGLCAAVDMNQRVCSQLCDSELVCPDGFECAPDRSGGALDKCFQRGSMGCGCAAGRSSSGGTLPFAVAMIAVALTWRSQRRRARR
jgi:MYXO-CTERM domain-containing protein